MAEGEGFELTIRICLRASLARTDQVLLEALSVNEIELPLQVAVAIEPNLLRKSPQNRNIRESGWRLSAIWLPNSGDWEFGDAVDALWETYPDAALPGWGGRVRTSAWWNQNPLLPAEPLLREPGDPMIEAIVDQRARPTTSGGNMRRSPALPNCASGWPNESGGFCLAG